MSSSAGSKSSPLIVRFFKITLKLIFHPLVVPSNLSYFKVKDKLKVLVILYPLLTFQQDVLLFEAEFEQICSQIKFKMSFS